MNLLGPDFSTARYWTEFDAQGERLVMPIRRSWKVVGTALLGFGFVIIKAHAVFGHEPGPFEYFAFTAMFAGAIYLVLNIVASMLTREVIQIAHGELIHGWRLLGARREKRYRLSEIAQLSIGDADSAESLNKLVSPLKDFGKAGMISFFYRGTKIGMGAGLDEAHGAQVVDWIARRAPRSVLEF